MIKNKTFNIKFIFKMLKTFYVIRQIFVLQKLYKMFLKYFLRTLFSYFLKAI